MSLNPTSTNGGVARSAEERAVEALKADGIDATLEHTGGGCMVAFIPMTDEGWDGPHICVTDGEDYTSESPAGSFAIGLYTTWEWSGSTTWERDTASLILADCASAMVEAVRDAMKEAK